MNRADIVFDLIARALGMERQKLELRALLDLYLDAAEQDAEEELPHVPEEDEDVGPPELEEPGPTPYYIEPSAHGGDDLVKGDSPPEEKCTVQAAEHAERYSGFLHLRCKHCGDVRTFCAKMPIHHFHCSACGKDTELETLSKVQLDCECGRQSKYRTNLTEWGFDVPCIACGNPVAVEYRTGLDRYATMGKSAAKGRKRKG